MSVKNTPDRPTVTGIAQRPRRHRPAVAIVTAHWGEPPIEVVGVTRLVAGALARHADVTVIHLTDVARGRHADSVFDVRPVALLGAQPARAALLRSAIGGDDPTSGVSAAALTLLREYDGEAPGVAEVLGEVAPKAVVLVGSHQPWDLGTLGRRGDSSRPRVVAIPFCSDRDLVPGDLARLIDAADVIGTIHPDEPDAITLIDPGRAPDVAPIELTFSSNIHARSGPLAGLGRFGRYVLLVRNWPSGTPRPARPVTREVLREVLGRITVVEVDGVRWWASNKKDALPLQVNYNRVNFSRLVAHASLTVDVRPQGPVGLLAIESMLYGVPALVPDATAAKAHVAAANGGLWYRDVGELFDGARAIVHTQLGVVLADQAERYALAKHGDIDAFVARTAELVLGSQVTTLNYDRRSAGTTGRGPHGLLMA
jgi:hypothetical protein